jgi:hypothetical protein
MGRSQFPSPRWDRERAREQDTYREAETAANLERGMGA